MKRHSPLPLYAAAAYTLLVVYASLHPFSGWRDSGVRPFDFIDGEWPRYFTVFDLIANATAYIPLGFLWVPALQLRLSRHVSAVIAILMAVLLSLSLETLQNYLPSRVPSNVDLGSNSLGGIIGALFGMRWGRALLSGGRLHELRVSWFIGGNAGETGLILMGAWMLAQLSPMTLLFGSGDLRPLFGLDIELPFDIEHFSHYESAVAASSIMAVGLVLSCMLRQRILLATGLLFATALAIRTLSYALLVDPAQALRWLTPGNGTGLGIGLGLLIPCLFLPATFRRALAGSALLLATVLVNLVPENPYLTQAAQVWRQGHFLNFNGLTRLASVVWPFVVLPWLLLKERIDE
jgi:VanZ family protein